MRTLFLLAVIIGGLVVAGVLHFQKNGDAITVTVDKDRLHAVEEKAVQLGSDFMHKAQADLDNATQNQTR